MKNHFTIKLDRKYSEEEDAFDDFILIQGKHFGIRVFCYLDDSENQMIDIREINGHADKEEFVAAGILLLIGEGEILHPKDMEAPVC